MDYLISFLIGGLICAAVQILMDRTKLMPGRIMVLLVCTGAVLGFCGIYELRGQRAASWIWKHIVAGGERGGRQKRVYRDLYGRI